MVNGSPLPTSLVPSRSLPDMPGLTNDSARSSWLSDYSSQHPHPLRSHSSETIPTLKHFRSTSQLLGEERSSTQCDRPDSSTINPTKTHHRHRRSLSQHHISLPPSYGLPPLPACSAIRSPSKEGFSDCAVVGAGRGTSQHTTDFPVVPSRPPLRPTVSFGGVSRFSYYSDISSEMERKSKEVAAIEEREVKEKIETITVESSSRKPLACLAILCLLSFGIGLSTTSTSTAFPTISRDLSMTAVQSFWIISSFLVANALFQPFAVRVADVTGPNPTILLGCLTYSVGSIVSGFAPSFPSLLFARCVEGAGTGTLTALARILLRQSGRSLDMNTSERLMSVSYWCAVSLGPIIGGAMASTTGWRGIFWVNATFGILGFVLLPFVLQPPNNTGGRDRRLEYIDYAGWVLLAGSLIGILVALSRAGTIYAWSSGHTLAPLIIGIVGIITWTQHMRYRIDTTFGNSVNAKLLMPCIGNAAVGMLTMAIVFTMPTFFIAAQSLSPSVSGLALGSWTFTLVLASFATMLLPAMIDRRLTICMCWAVLCAGSGLMMLLDQDTGAACYVPVGLFSGVSIGILHSSFSAAGQTLDQISDSASPKNTATLSFCHSLGQACGVVVGSTIFLNVLRQTTLDTPSIASNATGYTSNAVTHIGILPTSESMIDSYVVAIRSVWVFLCALTGIAFLANAAFTAASFYRKGHDGTASLPTSL